MISALLLLLLLLLLLTRICRRQGEELSRTVDGQRLAVEVHGEKEKSRGGEVFLEELNLRSVRSRTHHLQRLERRVPAEDSGKQLIHQFTVIVQQSIEVDEGQSQHA